MAYLALYRKYRPSNFDDLVAQEEVSSIIKNEILNSKISHAYLFSGPRGTGKTSTAKIIAKMINCSKLSKDGIPCGKCPSCLDNNSTDVVEIDAASNNGVDEIRELRDKVNLVPTYGKYKVYIIDEVHMLTTQAFNALLKTLEEPPAHAIFILATTEFYKIPATVVSRCQKFQFLKFTENQIVDRLSKICKLEKFSVANDVLYEIARLSDGGLRDAINMLDQLSSFNNGNVSIEDVYKLNGVVSYKEMVDLFNYIKGNNIKNIVVYVENLNRLGINLDKFVFDYASFLKDVLIYKNVSDINENNSLKLEYIKVVADNINISDLTNLIIYFNDISNKIKSSGFQVIMLITSLIKLSNDINRKDDESIAIVENNKINDTVVNNKPNKMVKEDKKDDNSTKKDNKVSDEIKKIRINNAFATASKDNKENFITKWNELKDSMNGVRHNSLVGVIDDVDVMVVGDKNIIFLVKYDSLLGRIYDYLDDFEALLFEYFNVKYKIVFIDNDEWNYEKDKYITNMKMGKKYSYIDKDIEKNDDNVYTNSDVDKIVSILGNDVISYK